MERIEFRNIFVIVTAGERRQGSELCRGEVLTTGINLCVFVCVSNGNRCSNFNEPPETWRSRFLSCLPTAAQLGGQKCTKYL